MLSAGFMDGATAAGLMVFREGHGGTLSGMTRYTDHLDDMPAVGYAIASLGADRIDQYLLLLHGHMANYQGRGSWFSDEQQSLYQNETHLAWRASIGNLQASFCTPSQTLAASMTAMQFVSTERDNATIWLARAAPRRWYDPAAANEHGVMLGAQRAPSRWGTVSFNISAPQAHGGGDVVVALALNFSAPAGGRAHKPTLMVRVRDPNGGNATIAGATVSDPGTADCVVVQTLPVAELVVVRPTPSAAASGLVSRCELSVRFERTPRQ